MVATVLIARACRQAIARVPRVAVVGVAVMVMSSGCGTRAPSAVPPTTNGDTASSESAATFAERVEATCAALDAQVAPVMRQLFAAGTATRDEMSTAIRAIVAAGQDQLVQLRPLDPPAEQRARFGRYVSALEVALAQIEDLIGHVGFDDVVGEGVPSPFFEAEAEADEMGIHGACGSGEASPDEPLTSEQRSDAAHVEVIASEYEWSGLPRTVAAGPTVFEFRNDGEELHELFLVQLVDGIDPDAAIEAAIARLESGEPQTEQPPEAVRRLGVARGGPHAIAALEANLTPATYMVICFLPDQQGVSHARHGMATWFEATA
jgi:hypothetical protein